MNAKEAKDIIERAAQLIDENELICDDNPLTYDLRQIADLLGKPICPHGEITDEGMCDMCYVESDFAYDCARERRW